MPTMDADRFDTLSRTLTTPGSRRTTLRALGALAFGGAAAASSASAEAGKNCPVCKKKKRGRCRKVKDGTLCSPEEGVHGECVSGHCCLPNNCTECPNVCAAYDALTECRAILDSGGVKTCCRPLQQICNSSDLGAECCWAASKPVSCRTIANKGTFGCGFSEANTVTRCCIPEGGQGSSGDCDCCGTGVDCWGRCISAACANNCSKSCNTDADCGSGCFLTCQEEGGTGGPKHCLPS
jgi:hypothetical protein